MWKLQSVADTEMGVLSWYASSAGLAKWVRPLKSGKYDGGIDERPEHAHPAAGSFSLRLRELSDEVAVYRRALIQGMAVKR